MANPIALSAPTIALTVLKEGFSLCQSIMDYRQRTMQVELAREQMHRQADIKTLEIQQEFEADMARLQALSSAFHQTLQQSRKDTKTKAQLIKALERQISITIETLGTPNLSPEVSHALSQALQMLISQQSGLYQDFIQQSQPAVNALAIFTDTIRTAPRTFTDVR